MKLATDLEKSYHHYRKFKPLSILAMIALVIQSGLLFIALFEPGLRYKISKPAAESLDSRQFIQTLEAITGGYLRQNNALQVFSNGENYYPAEVAAIRGAKRTVNIEAYIFNDGDVTDQVMSALIDRARNGVKVNLLIDAVGSSKYPSDKLKHLTDAGGRYAFYHALSWYSWPRYNNRTHRELTIVDGSTGFIGGAGYADHWLHPTDNKPRWRDTMVRVQGLAVAGLQATFAENWLESSGQIITGTEYFPFDQPPPVQGSSLGMVVRSSPTTGRSTEARVLFQTLIANASHRIYITTPYFLPDSSLRDELVRAVQRHVEVRILVPGQGSDHAVTRSSSRHLYGDLLQAGAKIFEYQPTMIHAKILLIDSIWAVVGSTNMDSRSFGINDEVNLAVLDKAFVQRLEADYETDLSKARSISYEEWKHRPLLERGHELFGSLIERQQ